MVISLEVEINLKTF